MSSSFENWEDSIDAGLEPFAPQKPDAPEKNIPQFHSTKHCFNVVNENELPAIYKQEVKLLARKKILPQQQVSTPNEPKNTIQTMNDEKKIQEKIKKREKEYSEARRKIFGESVN
ncbi:hypothetical protein BB561_000606 [Smittium simulii]|uniref:SUZ domain-containing protein n=1 Tax=Smittium simulii TaxID=133385 RepID=A0A2T9YYJ6_9FUNG|nr:hypothetical protein BB561_000606 [Smittium simulii]